MDAVTVLLFAVSLFSMVYFWIGLEIVAAPYRALGNLVFTTGAAILIGVMLYGGGTISTVEDLKEACQITKIVQGVG